MGKENTLYILWTNTNIETSISMVIMFAAECKQNKLWEDVIVIIGGATAKLAAENNILREKIRIAMQFGVKFTVGITSAKNLGVIGPLKTLGIEIIHWEHILTEIIKNNYKMITI